MKSGKRDRFSSFSGGKRRIMEQWWDSPARTENVLWLSILLLSCHEESMIAFMGEERVLRGGDNVLAATVEASLSEIKHDATKGWVEGRRGGVEVTPSQIFPYRFLLLRVTSD